MSKKSIKDGYRRRSCTSGTAKIRRFVIFVMYCTITVTLTWLPRAPFPTWQEISEFGPRFHPFLANFLLRMCRNGHNSTSSQIFNHKFETPMGCFLFEYNFGGASAKIYTCFERKTAFVMHNFQNLGANGVGVTMFDETPKMHILGWFHALRADPFPRFVARRLDEKRGTTKNHREIIFHVFSGNSPPN